MLSLQGCGLDLDASVARPSRGASVSPWLKFQTPRSRLGLKTERLGLGLGLYLDTAGLGLGLGSKCLGLVGKHFSITCVKFARICHFGSASVLRFPHFFLGLHQSLE